VNHGNYEEEKKEPVREEADEEVKHNPHENNN